MLWFDPVLQKHFAWALVHFLWLACIPAGAFAIACRTLPADAAHFRYRCGMATLVVTVILFMVAWQLAGSRVSKNRFARAAADARQDTTIVFPVSGLLPAAISNDFAKAASTDIALAATVTTMKSGNTSSRSLIQASGWATWVTAAYGVGFFLCTLRLIVGYLLGLRVRRGAILIGDSCMTKLVARVSRRLGMTTAPVVLWCDHLVVPAVIGVLRPVVLLPASLATGVSIEQLEYILLHEFTHLRRRDPVVQFLQCVIETVFFFHPVVWWLSSQVRLYRELSCDAAVVSSGVDPRRYAETLIDIASWQRHAMAIESPVAVAAVSSGSQLRQRIAKLLGQEWKPRRGANVLIDTSSLLAVLLIVSLAFALGYQKTLAAPQVEGDAVLTQAPQSIEPTELAGIVVDASGEPLAGVTVDAWTWHAGDETTTDENGVFRFKPESENGRRKVEVRWTKPGFSPHYVAQQNLGVKDLVITLDSKTFIDGKITAINGTPAANVTIVASQQNIQGDDVMIGEVPTETSSDAEGKFRLYLFPDKYLIRVSSPQGVARIEGMTLNTGESITKDIALHPGLRFEAIVRDATSGEPFEGLVLSSYKQTQYRGSSDAQGRIVIEGMLPGDFEFAVGAGEELEFRGMEYFGNGPLGRWWSPDATLPHQQLEQVDGQFQRNLDGLTFDLKTDLPPVEIFVEAGVEFSGHVYDPDGKPLAGATVAPAKTGSGNSLTGDTRYSVTTKEDGSYRVIMPAGKDFQYNLMAFDGEYGQWRKWGSVVREPLETTPGQKVTDYDFNLTRGATVRGKVTSPDGADAPPRQVRAHGTDLLGNRYYDPTVEVKKDGTFELGGLRPGEHLIQVEPFWLTAADATAGTSVTITVKDGEVREGIELIVPIQDAPPPEQRSDLPTNVKMMNANAAKIIFTAKNKIFSRPCFDETSLYFGACDDHFYCIDKVTGKLRWKRGGLIRVDSNPVIDNGLVYFANIENNLFALRTDTGKLVWKTKIEGCGYNDPLLHDGLVWIMASDSIRGLRPGDGTVEESYPLNTNSQENVMSSLVAMGNRLIAIRTTDFNHNDWSGESVLSCSMRGQLEPAWSVALDAIAISNVVLADESRCYAPTTDHKLHCFGLQSGTAEWSMDFRDEFTSPDHLLALGLIDNGDSVVLAVSEQNIHAPGALICFDKDTGAKRWSVVNSRSFSADIVSTDASLIAITLDHRVVGLDRKTGAINFIKTLPVDQPQWPGEFNSLTKDGEMLFVAGGAMQVWRVNLRQLK